VAAHNRLLGQAWTTHKDGADGGPSMHDYYITNVVRQDAQKLKMGCVHGWKGGGVCGADCQAFFLDR
jgi:hypothetical protein